MRVVVRREEGCSLCTAMKVSFCTQLPDPYRKTCEVMVDSLGRGSTGAEEAFNSLINEVSPEIVGKARKSLMDYLKTVGALKN